MLDLLGWTPFYNVLNPPLTGTKNYRVLLLVPIVSVMNWVVRPTLAFIRYQFAVALYHLHSACVTCTLEFVASTR